MVPDVNSLDKFIDENINFEDISSEKCLFIDSSTIGPVNA